MQMTTIRNLPSATTTPPPPQVESTTQFHRPGLFAPANPQYNLPSPPKAPAATTTRRTVVKPQRTTTTWRPWTSSSTRKPWTSTTRRAVVTTTKRRQPPRENAHESTTQKRPLGPDSLAASNGFFTWFFEKQRILPKQREQGTFSY